MLTLMSRQKHHPITIAKAAGKPVVLAPSGKVTCGRITYEGKYTPRFKQLFHDFDAVIRRTRGISRDQSGEKLLFTEQILEHMELKWQRTVTIGRIRIFAEEARIRSIVTSEIMPIFMSYLNKKWRMEFVRMADDERRNHPTADTLL